MPTGILVKTDRPEYGTAYRKGAAAQRARKATKSGKEGKT
jgi:hypothetical protein